MIDRRLFLGGLTLGGMAALSAGSVYADSTTDSGPQFRTQNRRWQAAYDKALSILAGNVQVLPRDPNPVLTEGATYHGIWMECGPHEALVYRKFRPDVARNSHFTFFNLQRSDGQFPANNKLSETGFGQIQMVVPIAATAWELACATGDETLLFVAYRACAAWDDWLLRYRNTRGTGLTEGFCTYDTGHDNSPRWAGIPPQCPNKDAKTFPPGLNLPRLCPDLSATTYGARIALAAMADALGKTSEAEQWHERAEALRSLILSRLYVASDAAFYDLDANNAFVRVRSDILSRVCGEHVVDQSLFDDLWTRQIHNPQAFWAPYPLPSIALDDSSFVRPIPANSWGGASQALTALRAGRWMEHYDRSAEFADMMERWCEALQADMTFRQQLDPMTGVFSEGAPGYSPAALVMTDYTWRLAGVHDEAGDLWWNARPHHPASQETHFKVRTDTGKTADMRYQKHEAMLRLNDRPMARITGGPVRLITDAAGAPQQLQSLSFQSQTVTLHLPGHAPRVFHLAPRQRIKLG